MAESSVSSVVLVAGVVVAATGAEVVVAATGAEVVVAATDAEVVVAIVVGGAVRGTVVVPGAVVVAAVLLFELQLDAANASRPRHGAILVQRIGAPIQSYVPPPCTRPTSI